MLSSLASGHMVTTPEERQNGVLVDRHRRAARPTTCSTATAAPYTTGVVPVGGAHLTNDLSIGLRLTDGQAEKLKLRFGRAHRAGRATRPRRSGSTATSPSATGSSRATCDRADHRRRAPGRLLEVVQEEARPRLRARDLRRRASSSPAAPPSCPASPRPPPRSSACRPASARRRRGWARTCATPASAPRSACSTTALSSSAEPAVQPARRRRASSSLKRFSPAS